MWAAPSPRPLSCGFSEDCGLFVQLLGVITLPVKLASEAASPGGACLFAGADKAGPVSGRPRHSPRPGDKERPVFEEPFLAGRSRAVTNAVRPGPEDG